MKKKVLLTSALTIALCLSIIAGSSFALFTSESKVNVAVTAGTVDVEASISDLELYSPTAIDLNGVITDDKNAATTTTFANGGTATLEDGTLTLTNITPGDKVTFAIGIENKSNVSIKYRTILSCDEDDKELLSALKINIGGAEVVGESAWTALKANGTIESLPCSVELSAAVGNAYQNKSCTITFKIEAVQGNAETEEQIDDPAVSVTAAELLAILKESTTLTENYKVTDAWTPIKGETSGIYDPVAKSIEIDGNGHYISGLSMPLLAWNAAQKVTIKNLTIKDSVIGAGEEDNNYHSGAFMVGMDNTVKKLVLDNCHAERVSVTANAGSGSSAGALIGYVYTHPSDGLSSEVEIKNCSAKGCYVTNAKGNAAGITGMFATSVNVDGYTISNCVVENCTISGENAAKTGMIVGTVNNNGKLYITGCTFTGKAYGRIVGDKTVVDIDGTEYKN